MFCQKCGTENKDDATFCNACGVALKDPVPQVTASTPKEAPEAPKKKHGILFYGALVIGIIFLLIVGSAIMAAIVYAGSSGTKVNSSQPTIPNPTVDVLPGSTSESGTLTFTVNNPLDFPVDDTLVVAYYDASGVKIDQRNYYLPECDPGGAVRVTEYVPDGSNNYKIISLEVYDPTVDKTYNVEYNLHELTPQDPIIGVWRTFYTSTSENIDVRIRFNEDNTFVFSDYYPDTGKISPLDSGTWTNQGDNTYILVYNDTKGGSDTWGYDPATNEIFDYQYGATKYSRYTGDVMTTSPTSV
jgi:hypothetical protein